jgi:hypothetical protein
MKKMGKAPATVFLCFPFYGSAALPFVIPSEAEGSAVSLYQHPLRMEAPSLSPPLRSGRDDKFFSQSSAPVLQQNCHPDRSEPGFTATQNWTPPRVRLSVKKGA